MKKLLLLILPFVLNINTSHSMGEEDFSVSDSNVAEPRMVVKIPQSDVLLMRFDGIMLKHFYVTTTIRELAGQEVHLNRAWKSKYGFARICSICRS